ncbi:Prephenate dehydrogenase [Lactobacillus zymae] [Lactiplantibacillus mudanjiangensis]|uniref:prephenate dehydrogenase n=1 Tax=Lactiplantibacillus mudanjiangensis TaxID=1296538 RepID=UPI0010154FD9|nr:prephenate dehydrogenase [Lactiplantibacillus mudanjiangensis]VDG18468.1 Prephenate dehydrogenase [Lactobacillus zymae] [Lactiplantibacillus mudanjiangensis]VDG33773.1 Prephenate dehydrogenase [Lactobacillus zymae] [Lactiplantibacillus mudanjiangensis]
MTQVLIKGFGLIGSSLALAIRQAHPDVTIVGQDVQSASLTYALDHQLIDATATELTTAAPQADVIILAGPVSVICDDLAILATLPLKPQVLITDVGSTKQTVLKAARPLQQRGFTFVGGHPMAGSHKAGVQAGRADLFENAYYFLVPGLAPQSALDNLQTLLQATHVKWLTVTPKQHDRLVAQLSHLPHIVAAALVNQTQAALADSPLGLRLAAGGFKSITRIASADPTMWTAILQNNADLIIQQLQAYQAELAEIQTAIAAQDTAQLTQFFAAAKTTRDHLGPEHLGSLPNFYDLFLNIPDQVGALADVTQRLAAAELSLVNIHILEIREEVDGVLQVTFGDAATRDQAATLLQAADYQIVRRD